MMESQEPEPFSLVVGEFPVKTKFSHMQPIVRIIKSIKDSVKKQHEKLSMFGANGST
jgi:hypothetical protein